MEWRGEGMITAVRKHGETAAIVEVLTRDHGRHAGVVHGGASRKQAPVLQAGNQVEVEWRARLEEHLGTFRVELLTSRTNIMADRRALAALSSVCALVGFAVPERMELPQVYEDTLALIEDLAAGADWLSHYVHWEMQMLEHLGYGLDLGRCAATGVSTDLIYVSPKSGCAVSRNGAGDYRDRMLPLPAFLRDGTHASGGLAEVLDGLRMTGYFWENWVAPALGNRPLPAARDRFVGGLHKGLKRGE